MKTLLSIFVIVILHVQVLAQEVIRQKKTYKQLTGKKLEVDVFYPSTILSGEGNPAIAFFHGGGWAFGSPSEFYGACERYAKKGFIAFSFEYRLARDKEGQTPHPDITPVECVKDARSALRWLKANADSLKIDPQNIIVGGQSVGGQLAMATAMLDKVNEDTDNLSIDPTPAAVISYSGTVNPVSPWCDYLLGDKREQIWSISPYHNLKKDLPPAIAFHGKDDHVVSYWTVGFFQRETKKLGNYFKLIPYEGRKHYLGEGDEKGEEVYSRLFDEEILERTDEFLIKFGFMKKESE